MKNRYQSEALQVIHKDMKSMHKLSIINDVKMREFDEMCLIPKPEQNEPIEITHETVFEPVHA